ncbi:hypothetical protein ACFX15_008351 [Malus domestica]
MPGAFNDLAKVTRSHIPAANASARIYVPRVCHNPVWEGRTVPECGEAASSTWPSILAASQSSASTLKLGKPLGSKDSQPWKWKSTPTSDSSLNPTITYSSIPTRKVILDYSDVLHKTT